MTVAVFINIRIPWFCKRLLFCTKKYPNKDRKLKSNSKKKLK